MRGEEKHCSLLSVSRSNKGTAVENLSITYAAAISSPLIIPQIQTSFSMDQTPSSIINWIGHFFILYFLAYELRKLAKSYRLACKVNHPASVRRMKQRILQWLSYVWNHIIMRLAWSTWIAALTATGQVAQPKYLFSLQIHNLHLSLWICYSI